MLDKSINSYRLVFSKSSKVFLNVLFFFILNPYISPIPTGSDIQPLVGLFAGIIFIFILSTLYDFKLNKIEIYFIALCAYIILMPTIVGPSSFELRKRIGLLFSFFIFYICSRTTSVFSYKVLVLSACINFGALVFQIISPGVFKTIIGFFLRAVKFHEGTGRGFTGLAPEPSFWGYSMVFHIVLLDFFNKENIKRLSKYIVLIFCSIIVILTKSGTSYLFSLLFIGIWIMGKLKRKKTIIVIASLLWITLANIPEDSIKSRGLLILKHLSSDPSYILMDSSMASRINQVSIGCIALTENPLGTGGGSFIHRANKIYYDNKLYEWYKVQSVRKRIEKELSAGAISTFAQYSIELGVFYLILVLLLFSKLNWKRKNIFIIFMFTLIAILQSFPIVYPPVWFLLAAYSKKEES